MNMMSNQLRLLIIHMNLILKINTSQNAMQLTIYTKDCLEMKELLSLQMKGSENLSKIESERWWTADEIQLNTGFSLAMRPLSLLFWQVLIIGRIPIPDLETESQFTSIMMKVKLRMRTWSTSSLGHTMMKFLTYLQYTTKRLIVTRMDNAQQSNSQDF